MNGRHSHSPVARVFGGAAGAVGGGILGFVAVILAIAITGQSLGGFTVWHGGMFGAAIGILLGAVRPMRAAETLLDLLWGVGS